MRRMQDPARREIVLGFYRMGFSHKEVAHAIGLGLAVLTRETELDPSWNDQVQAAMLTSYRPILHHATQLALEADPEGINMGSHNALKLVMDWYSKQLDRESQAALAQQQAEALEQRGQRFPILASPDAVSQFIKELQAGPVQDAESWEETADDEDDGDEQEPGAWYTRPR